MQLSSLTAISPLDGRYGNQTEQLRSIVSEYGLIFYRLQIEITWLIALSDHKQISEVKLFTQDEREFLKKILDQFDEHEALAIKQIELKTNHDVKAVEYYLRKKCEQHPALKKISSFIHFGCTSEDINNLAHALMVKKSRDEIILPALKKLIEQLNQHARETATLPMLSRTHGQAATPTTMGKEFKNFSTRLAIHVAYFAKIPISGKCNGAVGNFNAHGVAFPDVDWQQMSKQFVESLGLQWNAHTTQIEPHDYFAQFLNALTICHTILIDCCRDVWGYISLHYFLQKKIDGEVGSSTMPHKINPIDFENAEGNLGLAITLATHLSQKLPISRFQRDLSDSTVLRNTGSIFGYTIIAYRSLTKGLNKLIPNPDMMKKELMQHWELLAEPIQMVMRRYGMDDAYEQLKKITRGETITQKQLHDFIDTLPVPDQAKKELKLLTPENYVGIAAQLAR
ncbi:MAG: hypothetical protein ACD_42C00032G0001 [uncultured bacterium]|nr:MAG: hypothetical protein ACD_42C00032G0001 [uncultured bacterium]OGT34384.1 MAG: adenylosuccinate lyase [Gammaproteobacteria bacterium RIFCSPHIGHO2_02_FULL_39_13]OGT50475.1 MAG: adenylosuccinate lyase [Gammaproteobacteria bacterium RIFCSPHIGHO2_12_FULL_39_24]